LEHQGFRRDLTKNLYPPGSLLWAKRCGFHRANRNADGEQRDGSVALGRAHSGLPVRCPEDNIFGGSVRDGGQF
jgi:hypothetical protein